MSRSTKVLLVTAASVFLSFLDATIVNVAFPAIRGAFDDASLADASWVLSAYSVVFAALLIPAGLAGDLLGRRRMFLGGLTVFVLASGLCALAPSIAFLVAARIVQAAGAAAVVPSSLGLLLPEFPPERRASATALWGASGAVAAATGPTLGGLLVERLDWRWVFVVNLPLGVVAITAASRVLVEREDAARARRPDLIGAGLLIAGIALVVLGVTEGPRTQWGWGDARTVACLVGAAVSLVAFLARSRRREDAIVDLGLCERYGTRAVAVPGVLLFALGCALFAARAGTGPAYVGVWLPAAMVCGVGIGTTFAAFGAAAVADLPPQRFATGGAVTQTSRQIGAALGVAAFVAVFGSPAVADALDAFHRCWWAMTGSALAASLCAVALPRAASGPAGTPAAPAVLDAQIGVA